ncbi:hypothetical protein R6Z07F_018953 [Ovis aries]
MAASAYKCLAGRGAAPVEIPTASDRRLRAPPPPPQAAGAKEALGKGQSHTLGGRDPRPSSVAAVESLQTQLWSSATTAAGKTCPCPPTPAASPALFSLHQPGTPQFPQGPPAMSDPDIRRGPDVPAMWPPCSRGA